jgi:excisionase family DNA binding protein
VSALDDLFDDLPARLTVEQVANLLGVESDRTVYGWLRRGEMPGYRIRGGWLILRDEIKDWVAAGSNQRAGQPAPEDLDDEQEDSGHGQ